MIDAASPALRRRFQHGRDGVLAAEQHAEDVDVHRLLIRRHRRGDRVVVVAEHHAGVVVQDVQSTERLHGVLHGGFDRAFVGDVAAHEARLSTGGGDRFDRVVAVGQIGDHHACPLGGEQLGTDTAQSRRRTGDQSHFPSQTIHGGLR